MRESDQTIVSIFVNPAQFAPHEDLDAYPRTIEEDLQMLQKAGAHAVFVPTVSEMYPSGIEPNVNRQVGAFVEVKGLSHQLEGRTRPHFFRGVTSVMSRLLNIISPEKVYFGQKDIQQCVVMTRLLKDLHFPTEMRMCPTIREADGLAMSSRNAYLTPHQRRKATVLWRALCASRDHWQSNSAAGAEAILNQGRSVVRQMESESNGEVVLEYLALSDPTTLKDVASVSEYGTVILSGAVRIGESTGKLTRIIDNIFLGESIR